MDAPNIADATARAYALKHRNLLKKAARASYGFFRIGVTFFGLTVAILYALTPHIGVMLVPDFALTIFALVLAFLFVSEIIFRMVKYSSDRYSEDDVGDKDCETCKVEKISCPMHFALNFPFRGLHLFLMGIWFFLSLYYLIFSAVMASVGTAAMVYPENFLLSFYIVSAACALDFLAKGIFIFRVPEIGKFVEEVAIAAIESREGLIASFISKAVEILFSKKPTVEG